MCEQLAVRAEDNAVAIENKLVLAADEVDVSDEGSVVRGSSRDHFFAGPALAGVIRRTVDVDQQLGAVVRLPCHRAGRIPAVLADRHADLDAGELEERTSVAGCERTL